MRRGRLYWRRRCENHRLRWFEVPEEPAPGQSPVKYDAVALMRVIDRLPRRIRDEINKRGLEQDIYDRLPYEAQIRIGEIMSPDITEADLADVWD